jgi:L-amino acid N-acyltransferase YncA
MIVRAATEADLPGMIEIENREIAEGLAHFGTEPVTLEQVRNSFGAAQGRHPWFVAAEGELIVGFARSGSHKVRESYRWTVEIGVYVRPEYQGQGVGNSLYASLFPALKEAGIRTVIAGIALPNPASVKLHESFGMEPVGTFPKVGFKRGHWIDVGYWALHWE